MMNCRKHPQEVLDFLLVPTGETYINEYGEIEYKQEIKEAICYQCMLQENKKQ